MILLVVAHATPSYSGIACVHIARCTYIVQHIHTVRLVHCKTACTIFRKYKLIKMIALMAHRSTDDYHHLAICHETIEHTHTHNFTSIDMASMMTPMLMRSDSKRHFLRPACLYVVSVKRFHSVSPVANAQCISVF